MGHKGRARRAAEGADTVAGTSSSPAADRLGNQARLALLGLGGSHSPNPTAACTPESLTLPQAQEGFGTDTLSLLGEQREAILAEAARFGVPPEVVATSLGSEYDRQWVKDHAQDLFALMLPGIAFDLDNAIYGATGFDGRGATNLLNVMNFDLGRANIKVKTAYDLATDPDSPAGKLLREQLGYASPDDVDIEAVANKLMSPDGEVLFASAIVANGQEKIDALKVSNPDLQFDTTEDHRNASLVSYFKEGDQFFDRAQQNQTPGCPHPVSPNVGGEQYMREKGHILDILHPWRNQDQGLPVA